MQARHFVQLVVLSAFWGGSFPLARIASPAFGFVVLTGLRCVLAAVVLAILMRVLREHWPAWRHWPRLGAVGLLSVVAPFLFYNWAALVVPAGYLSVLNATAPLFGVLAGAASGQESISGRSMAGCVAGFSGVALLMQLGPLPITAAVVLGALSCLVAAACYGVGAIFMKRVSAVHPPLAAAATIFVCGSLVMAIPMGLTLPPTNPSTGAWLAAGVLGLVTSGFMYWISLRLMREISASAATSSTFMIPLFGVAWGAIFLGEPVSLGMVPGGLLILVAMGLITGFNPFARACETRK